MPRLIARGITLLPDEHSSNVPNVGIVEGNEAVLVVDAGVGPEGERALEIARGIAKGRRILRISTHDAGGSGGSNEWDLGDRKVELRAMPARTRSDLVVYVPDEGVLFGGDLIEEGFHPTFPNGDSKGRQWIEALQSIEAMRPQIVVPGHGFVGSLTRVTTMRVYLETLEQRVGALAKQDLSQADVVKQLAPELKALHPAWRNDAAIPDEIAIYYAEATGHAPELPSVSSAPAISDPSRS
jgi:glyoxylase-like metal-dependent hydrolase (beta-lactamase superfamily II)